MVENEVIVEDELPVGDVVEGEDVMDEAVVAAEEEEKEVTVE